MKKPLVLLALVLLVASLMVAGCGRRPYDPPTPIPTLPPATLPLETPTEAVAEAAPTEVEAAAPTAATESAPESGADLVQQGEEIFQQTCSVCHNLTVEALVGPGLAGLFDRDNLPNGQPVTEENLKEWIVTGGGAMPGLPLTQDQLDAVVAFLKDATQP